MLSLSLSKIEKKVKKGLEINLDDGNNKTPQLTSCKYLENSYLTLQGLVLSLIVLV